MAGATERSSARSLSDKFEVGYLGRGDSPCELQPTQIVTDAVEQPFAAAEERRHDGDLHLVDEAGRQILLRDRKSVV